MPKKRKRRPLKTRPLRKLPKELSHWNIAKEMVVEGQANMATELSIGVRTLRDWIKKWGMPCHFYANRYWFLRPQVDAWVRTISKLKGGVKPVKCPRCGRRFLP